MELCNRERACAGITILFATTLLTAAGCTWTEAPADLIDSGSWSVTSANGIQMNGIGVNGIGVNGIGVNGIGPNALSTSGIGGSAETSGAPLRDVPLTGLYINALGQNGVALDGTGTNQIGIHGGGSNGLLLSGIVIGSPYASGTGAPGTAVDGAGLDGFAIDSLYINGSGVDSAGGVVRNGIYAGESPLGQVGLDGLHVNGTAAATGIRIGTGDGTTGLLSPTQEAIFASVMSNLVGCALPAGTWVTIYASDGTPRVFAGDLGLAPEWQIGPLASVAGAVDSAERVRACVDTLALQHGIALNVDQEDDLDVLLRYTIECALPPSNGSSKCENDPGCARLYAGSGSAKLYYGAFGLAPEWRDQALSESGARAVSGCLAARTNALGKPVQISLRSNAMAPPPGFEKHAYSWREGAFWGNLFADTPEIYSCVGDGPGLGGRRCTQPDGCGFTALGPCDVMCSGVSADDAHYEACNGVSEVMTTFLPISRSGASGSHHQCLVDTGGTVWCWGSDDEGQLGDGRTLSRLTPVAVSLPQPAAEVAAGDAHSCARTLDGKVWCWGRNDMGQLGDGTTIGRSLPAPVALDEEAHRLVSGWDHTCALTADGRLFCWGRDMVSSEPLATPVDMALSGLAYLGAGAGGDTVCALRPTGRLDCQGMHPFTSPNDKVYEWLDARSVPGEHVDTCIDPGVSCILSEDASTGIRTVYCCNEDNDFGQLGPGQNSGCHPIPLPAEPLPGTLSCMDRAACTAVAGGDVYCWGKNDVGQLGDGTTTSSAAPVRVQNLPAGTIRQSLSGRQHMCAALVTTGGAFEYHCWGFNGNGELGDGTTTNRSTAVRMTAMDPTPTCGNGVCDEGETSLLCGSDCGAICGDGLCSTGEESCSSCTADCGVCE